MKTKQTHHAISAKAHALHQIIVHSHLEVVLPQPTIANKHCDHARVLKSIHETGFECTNASGGGTGSHQTSGAGGGGAGTCLGPASFNSAITSIITNVKTSQLPKRVEVQS